MALWRYLDEKESIAAEMTGLERAFPLTTIKYRGDINVEALKLAFSNLFTRHPVLRGKIKKDKNRYVLHVPNGHYPQLQITEGEKVLLPETEALTKNRNGECVRILLIRGRSKGYVIFGIDHIICDVASVSAYWTELWRLYTDIVEGYKVVSIPGTSLPPPPSESYASLPLVDSNTRNREVVGELPAEAPTKNSTNFPPAHVRHFSLSVPETEQLRNYCSNLDIGVSPLLIGTMFSLLRQLETENGIVPMKFITIVDPRKNSIDQIGGEGSAELVWKAIRTFNTYPQEDFLSTVRRIHGFLKMLRNEKPDPPLSLDRLRKIVPQLYLRFNNGGVVMPRMSTPRNIELVDFFAPNEQGDEEGNTVIPNSMEVAFSPFRSTITCYSFNGKFKAGLTLRGDLNESILEEFENKLRSCVRVGF